MLTASNITRSNNSVTVGNPLETVPEFVTNWLKSNGFFEVKLSSLIPKDNKSFYLEADGDKSKIFVKVHIVKAHRSVSQISSKDLEEIKELASSKNMQPWAATVILDTANNVQSIRWFNLSKT